MSKYTKGDNYMYGDAEIPSFGIDYTDGEKAHFNKIEVHGEDGEELRNNILKMLQEIEALEAGK